MSVNPDESMISNQEKIQLLKEKIKNADYLNPKAPSNSHNNLHLSASPIEDTFQQPSKHFEKMPTHQNEPFPLQVRFMELEDRLASRLDNEYKILDSVDASIKSLQEEVRTTKRDVDRNRENMEERTLSVERQANQDVVEQSEEIKLVRKDLIDSIQKKYKTIKTETMAVIGSHFESGWEETKEELISQIEDLKAQMDSEEAAKDEAVNFMVNSFGEEILKLEQMVQKEKEERMESHERILTGLQRMEDDVTTLIFHQKKQTNQGISQLEDCLENVCLKIENHLLH